MRRLGSRRLLGVNRNVVGDHARVVDPSALDTVVSETYAEIGGYDLYANVFLKAAHLARGLAVSAPFAEGNDETAFLAAVTLLAYNDVHLREVHHLEPMIFIFGLHDPDVQTDDAAAWFVQRRLGK